MALSLTHPVSARWAEEHRANGHYGLTGPGSAAEAYCPLCVPSFGTAGTFERADADRIAQSIVQSELRAMVARHGTIGGTR